MRVRITVDTEVVDVSEAKVVADRLVQFDDRITDVNVRDLDSPMLHGERQVVATGAMPIHRQHLSH